jgi:hypothetical protein
MYRRSRSQALQGYLLYTLVCIKVIAVMTAEAGLYPLVRGREERTKTKTTKTTTF